MKCAILFSCVWLTAAALFGVSADRLWVAGKSQDLKRLHALLGATNTFTCDLRWESGGVVYHRALTLEETQTLVKALAGLEVQGVRGGIYDAEVLVGSVCVTCDDRQATMPVLNIAESQRVFVSFHTASSYDSIRKCFAGNGLGKLIRQLKQRPGAVEDERFRLKFPPVKSVRPSEGAGRRSDLDTTTNRTGLPTK